MRRAAGWAITNTRVRVARGTLAGVDLAARLAAARDRPALAAALRDAGIADPSPAGVRQALGARLAARYRRVHLCVPEGAELVLALARLHELDNLALLWRAVTRGHRPEAWRPLWFPMGELAVLDRGAAEEARTPADLARLCARTPYQQLGARLARAHGDDPLAGELAIDRFGDARVRETAMALSSRESDACALALGVVEEREAGLAARARGFGLEPPAEARPRRPVAELRRERRRDCRRAFLGSPFRLAPALALLLLEEAELRAITALVEAHGAPPELTDPLLAEALAGSLLEAER